MEYIYVWQQCIMMQRDNNETENLHKVEDTLQILNWFLSNCKESKQLPAWFWDRMQATS